MRDGVELNQSIVDTRSTKMKDMRYGQDQRRGWPLTLFFAFTSAPARINRGMTSTSPLAQAPWSGEFSSSK
jgi:hypothetical protein